MADRSLLAGYPWNKGCRSNYDRQKHPIPHIHGQAIECLLCVFWKKNYCVIKEVWLLQSFIICLADIYLLLNQYVSHSHDTCAKTLYVYVVVINLWTMVFIFLLYFFHGTHKNFWFILTNHIECLAKFYMLYFTGPKLFVKPSAKSNRHIIHNAISHCCLAGTVNSAVKQKTLDVSIGKRSHKSQYFMSTTTLSLWVIRHKSMLASFLQLWNSTGSWNHSPGKMNICLSCIAPCSQYHGWLWSGRWTTTFLTPPKNTDSRLTATVIRTRSVPMLQMSWPWFWL